MFGKLIKHELRASGRIMLPLIIALPCLGLLSNLAVRLMDKSSGLVNTLCVIVLMLFGFGCMAICVASFVVMILRWYRSVHSDEGYLTNTLPVSVHGIIWSRLLTAAIWFALSIAALILSVLLMTLSRSLLAQVREMFAALAQIDLAELDANIVRFVLEGACLGLAYAVARCLHFYAAISVGHAFSNHKGGWSVLAYAVMQFVFVTVAVKTVQFVESALGLTPDSLGNAHGFLTAGMVGMLLYAAVCYAITAFAVKRKLNL